MFSILFLACPFLVFAFIRYFSRTKVNFLKLFVVSLLLSCLFLVLSIALRDIAIATDLRKFDTNYNGKLVDGEIVPEARRLLDHQSFGRTKAPIFGFVVAIVGNTFFVRYCGCRKAWFVNAISRTTLSFHLHIQIQMETHTRHRTMDSKALN